MSADILSAWRVVRKVILRDCRKHDGPVLDTIFPDQVWTAQLDKRWLIAFSECKIGQ
jgi:hypothetical protein